jgi:hypothetical protein
MNASPPPKSLHRALRWLARQTFKNGWKTGRWLAWLFLPVWLLVVALGALAEFIEHA